MADIRQQQLGIYKTLKARIDLINRSIGHAGTQGAETEQAIQKLLEDFLPSDFGIGSGVIVGSDGSSSKQADIVIYDRSRPDYSLSNDSKIFLVDHVLAAIEIKTTFTSGSGSSLNSALQNIQSVKRLKPAPRAWTESRTDLATGKFEVIEMEPTPPLGIVFFFGAPERKTSLDLDAHFDVLRAAVDTVPVEEQPDLMFSLSHGSFFKHEDIGHHTESSQRYAAVLVQTGNSQDQVLQLDATQADAAWLADFSGQGLPLGQSELTAIQSTTGEQRILAFNGPHLTGEPLMHRVAVSHGAAYLIDAERAFLNFVYAVDYIVRLKRPSRVWSVADYFGQSFVAASNHPTDFQQIGPSPTL